MTKEDINLKIDEVFHIPRDKYEKSSFKERINRFMEIKPYFDDFEDYPIYKEYISKISNEEDDKLKSKIKKRFLNEHILKDEYIMGLPSLLIHSVYAFHVYIPSYSDKKFTRLFEKAGYSRFTKDSISKVAEFDLSLLESIGVLTIALRLDYWSDIQDRELEYLIGNNTITRLLNHISRNMDDESIKEVEDFLFEHSIQSKHSNSR